MNSSQLVTASIYVDLIAPTNDDLDILYSYCQRQDRIMTWRYRGRNVPKDKFISDFWQETLTASVVFRKIPNKRTKYRVGLISAYNANFRNQLAYLSIIAFPPFLNSGVLFAGIERFIDRIFANWPFRKIYFETLEFNLGQFGSVFDLYAQEEGRYREFEFYNNRYWDLVIGSISRDRWFEVKGKVMAKIDGVEISTNTYPNSSINQDDFIEIFIFILKSMFDVNLNHYIDMDSRLIDDLDLDSLDLIELIAAFESKFEIQIEDEELFEIQTVQDLFDLVRNNATRQNNFKL